MPVKINKAKYRFTHVSVAIGILLVAWQIFISPLSYTFQLFFFIISLFALGIQHGALDHVIEVEIARQKQVSFHIIMFLTKYSVLILIYTLFWYLLPQLSFLFFILMSAWHFGETDITGKGNKLIAGVAKLLYGVSVIGWILFSHSSEAADIISHIIPPDDFIYQLWLAAVIHPNVILIACGSVIVVIAIINWLMNDYRQNAGLLINLFLILMCCRVLPLLPSFALYFAGWHSLITLCNINIFTRKENESEKPAMMVKLWLKALPLSLTAIAGLLITGYFLRQHAPLFEPLPLLFVFLSLITLPHVGVMHQLNKRLFH